MTENKKEINVSFRLRSIDIIEEKLEQPLVQSNKMVLFKFATKAWHTIVPETKSISVQIEVNISADEDPKTLGYFKVGFIYEIENFNSFVKKKPNTFQFPPDFPVILNSLSLSSVRGIMFSHLKGTFLHGALLPIMNANINSYSKNIG